MAFQSSLLLEGIKTGAITPKGLFIDTSKAAVLELKNESNELVGLAVGGKVIVQRGDIIELSKEDTILESESGNPIAKCKVLSIRKSSRPYDYEISFFHSTLSSLFVLPLLNFDNIKSVNLECFVKHTVSSINYKSKALLGNLMDLSNSGGLLNNSPINIFSDSLCLC